MSFRPLPHGVSAVVEAIGDHVLGPAVGAFRSLLPADLGGELEAGVHRVVDVVAGSDPGAAPAAGLDPQPGVTL